MIALGNYAEADRTRIKDFINAAQKDIVSRTRRWRWLEASSAISTVAATQTVALPASVKYPGRLRPVTSGLEEPTYVDWYDFEENFPRYPVVDAAQGMPEYWSLWNNTFYFYPVPDAVYQYTFYYFKTLTDLSVDADVSSLPTEHHDALTYGALMLMAGRDKDAAMMAYWQNMYEGQIKVMLADNSFRQVESVRKVPMPRHYGGIYDR